MNKINLPVLFFVLLFGFYFSSYAQEIEQKEEDYKCQNIMSTTPSIYGNTGLIMTPTARFIDYKDIVFSVNSLPYTSVPFANREDTYNGSNKDFYQMLYSVSFNIFPCLELTGGFKVNDNANFSKDFEKERSLKLRFLLFSERTILPSVVIGTHDIFSGDKSSATSYIVASKGFKGIFDVHMDLHLGYGSRENDVFWIGEKKTPAVLGGVFGGVMFAYKDFMSVLLESKYNQIEERYDFNAGVNVLLTNRLGAQVRMLGGGNAFSFGINYTLTPGKWFKKRNTCIKNESNIAMSDKVDDWLLSIMDREPKKEIKEEEKSDLEKWLAGEEDAKTDSLVQKFEEKIDEKIDEKLKKELEELEKTLNDLTDKLNDCCQAAQVNEASNSLGIVYFGFNVRNIKAGGDVSSRAKIGKVAEVLKANPSFKLKVIGHTDKVGSNTLNDKLGMERAKAVADVLINEYKIDKNRISVISKGKNQPRSNNDDDNRRVEFALEK